jgi:hypothetical protein
LNQNQPVLVGSKPAKLLFVIFPAAIPQAVAVSGDGDGLRVVQGATQDRGACQRVEV